MIERKYVRCSWCKPVAIVIFCAALSAIVNGIIGFFLLTLIWNMNESALFGAVTGFWCGIVVGAACSIFMLIKKVETWKIFGNTILMALFFSQLIVLIATVVIAGLPF